MKFHVLALFFSMLAVVLLFLHDIQVYQVLFESKQTLPRLVNSYCQFSTEESCTLSLKKPKLFWIMLDAYSVDASSDLKHQLGSFYHLKPSGYSQSAAIAATFLTGRASRNYVGSLLTEDTLVDQLTWAKLLVSSHFPLESLLGDLRFNKTFISNRKERFPMENLLRANRLRHGFPEPFGKMDTEITGRQEAKRFVSEAAMELYASINLVDVERLLYELTKKYRRNIIYYSSIMDSYNHNYAASSAKTLTMAAAALASVKAIVNVLRTTPLGDHFVLAVSSDHGGQLTFGEDEICNHGCLFDQGNEGFLYIYNKDIHKFPSLSQEETWIEQIDVAPTIAEHLRHTGIPIHATGMPMPLTNATIHRAMAMRSKLIQLSELLRSSGKTVELPEWTKNYEQVVKEYPSLIQSLESQVQKSVSFWFSVIFLATLAAILVYATRNYISIDTGLAFNELAWIFCLIPFYRRIEVILVWPTLIGQLFIIVNTVFPLNSLRKQSYVTIYPRIKNEVKELVKMKGPQLFTVIIALGNLLLYLSSKDKIYGRQNYTFYYYYFVLLETLLFLGLRSVV